MGDKHTVYIMLTHGAIACIVVIAASVLAYHGSLDASAVTAIFGAALGFAGGVSSAVGAVNGKAQVSDATLREAIANPHTPRQPEPEAAAHD